MAQWILIGAINGFLAVALGAFGAHGLQGKVADRAFSAFETAAHYHLIHAVALVGIGLFIHLSQSQTANWAGWAMLAGMILFSGTLYHYGITESRALVMITPIGGLLFLTGWALLAFAAWKSL